MRIGQHAADLRRDRLGDLLRPGLEQELGDPVSAVMKIRNGNSDISAASAMWLAMAQPSSRKKPS
jgi:hypothetical protein